MPYQPIDYGSDYSPEGKPRQFPSYDYGTDISVPTESLQRTPQKQLQRQLQSQRQPVKSQYAPYDYQTEYSPEGRPRQTPAYDMGTDIFIPKDETAQQTIQTRQTNASTVNQRLAQPSGNPASINFSGIGNSVGNAIGLAGSAFSSAGKTASSASKQALSALPRSTQPNQPKTNSFLGKVAGLSQFNPYPTAQTKSVNQVAKKVDDNESFTSLNRSLSNTDLEYRTKIEAATLQANINRVKQYEPLANNEANRALGNELQTRNKALGVELETRLPYNAYQNDSNRFKGAETLSSTLPGILSALKYSNNNVSVSF